MLEKGLKMFKKVKEDAILPTRGSKYSACVDVYANEDVVIGAGETKLVGLGIAIELGILSEKISSMFIGNRKFGILHLPTPDFIQFREQFAKSHYLQLMLRISLGKKGLIIPNGVVVINLDYKDELKIIIHNPLVTAYFGEGDRLEIGLYDKYEIKKGDKIGQITLLEHKSYLFGIDSEDERDGGFGSTGER